MRDTCIYADPRRISHFGVGRCKPGHFQGSLKESSSLVGTVTLKRQREPLAQSSELSTQNSPYSNGLVVRKLGRRPGLDGLRGLAWLSVFVGHVQPFTFIDPADTGMFVFFGLSGFLITQLLIEEYHARHTLSLRGFFKRRLARLFPALVVFLAVWFVVVWIFDGSAWLSTVPQGGASQFFSIKVAFEGVLASLTYLINWIEINRIFTGYVPIGHIWSLAVEMQFYVFWAIALGLFLRYGRGTVIWIASIGSLAASAEAIWLMHHGATGLRVYMGTDVRAGSLLAGAAAALIWSNSKVNFASSSVFSFLSLSASIVVLWSMFAFRDPTFSIAQQAAWPLTALACAVLVVYLVERPNRMGGRWSLHPVMQYLGKRSYALYLWHYVWLTWFASMGIFGILAALGMSIISAELSWRFVEQPVSRWYKQRANKRDFRPSAFRGKELQIS